MATNDEMIQDQLNKWKAYKNTEAAIEAPAWYADPINYLQGGASLLRAAGRGIINSTVGSLAGGLGIKEGIRATAPSMASKIMSKVPSGELKDVANLASWTGQKLGIGGKGFANKALDTAWKNPFATFVAAANAPGQGGGPSATGSPTELGLTKPPAEVVPPPVKATPPAAVIASPVFSKVNVGTQEEGTPTWASKNGFNVSGINGKTPKGEQPTAVRGGISLVDQPDTTLIANPNYNKGVVDGYGYGKHGMGGHAHIDDRKYIEVPNTMKGEKVPLLEAIGFGKRKPADVEPLTLEGEIAKMKEDPNMRINGGLSHEGWRNTIAAMGHKGDVEEAAKARVEVAKMTKDSNDVYKNAMLENAKNQTALKESDEAKSIYREDYLGIVDAEGKKVLNVLGTAANMAEKLAPNGEEDQIPVTWRPVYKTMLKEFEKFYKKGNFDPKQSEKQNRKDAWAKWREALRVPPPGLKVEEK